MKLTTSCRPDRLLPVTSKEIRHLRFLTSDVRYFTPQCEFHVTFRPATRQDQGRSSTEANGGQRTEPAQPSHGDWRLSYIKPVIRSLADLGRRGSWAFDGKSVGIGHQIRVSVSQKWERNKGYPSGNQGVKAKSLLCCRMLLTFSSTSDKKVTEIYYTKR